jgi:hypothetical protein
LKSLFNILDISHKTLHQHGEFWGFVAHGGDCTALLLTLCPPAR